MIWVSDNLKSFQFWLQKHIFVLDLLSHEYFLVYFLTPLLLLFLCNLCIVRNKCVFLFIIHSETTIRSLKLWWNGFIQITFHLLIFIRDRYGSYISHVGVYICVQLFKLKVQWRAMLVVWHLYKFSSIDYIMSFLLILRMILNEK